MALNGESSSLLADVPLACGSDVCDLVRDLVVKDGRVLSDHAAIGLNCFFSVVAGVRPDLASRTCSKVNRRSSIARCAVTIALPCVPFYRAFGLPSTRWLTSLA